MDHRVFVWDMPGYGRSAKYDGQDVSLAAQGRVFGELLEHWGLTAPTVIAHDFGGAVALRAHLLHERPYRRLGQVDPGGTDDAWIPAIRGRELADLIPGARLQLIAGAGHLVQEDAPAELATALWSML